MFAFLLLVASSAFAAAAPVALKLAVDGLTIGHSPVVLIGPPLFVGGYVLSQWLSRCSGTLQWAAYGPALQRLQRRISRKIFAHVMALPMRFHVDRKTGALSQTLAEGISGAEIVLDQVLFSVLPVVVEFSLIAVILIQLGQPVVLYVLVTASILYAAAFALGVRRIGSQSVAISSAAIESNAVLTDSILNYEIVKYFNAEGFVHDGYDRALARSESHWTRLYHIMVSNGLAVAAVFAVSLGASVGYAAYEVIHGAMTVGDFVLVNAYVLQLVHPLETLGVALQNVSRGLGFVANMLELLRQQPEKRTPGRYTKHSVRGELKFEHVNFSYRAGFPVLRDVTFTIAPGRTLAVVGPSGAGKSSLVRLLLRLYEPDRGRILLDGFPISEMSLSALRDAIAVVPQDTILFNDTIAYNIAFGKRESTTEEVKQAARIAHLHQFTMTLPDGYDTIVGERGVKLSGGEKQRVAIARAALKRPNLYVFDEATSSLDTPTEQAILRDLIDVSQGCTTLAIAHRLSTIVHANEIIVLERGAITERGAHASLLKLNGSYAAMWRAQQDTAAARDARAVSIA